MISIDEAHHADGTMELFVKHSERLLIMSGLEASDEVAKNVCDR